VDEAHHLRGSFPPEGVLAQFDALMVIVEGQQFVRIHRAPVHEERGWIRRIPSTPTAYAGTY
jgi:hypothetical protein